MILTSDFRDSKKLMLKHMDCEFVIDRQYCTEQKMGVQNLGSFILQAHTDKNMHICPLIAIYPDLGLLMQSTILGPMDLVIVQA